MPYVLKPGREKEWAVQFFKSFSVDSMQKGKGILYRISKDKRYTSLNEFLNAAGKEFVERGEYWGWKNLYWELLSNKYGVVALYNQKTKKTKFVFRLPPIEDIREEISNEAERLNKETERREEITWLRMMLNEIPYVPPLCCFQPACPSPPCTVHGAGGQG